MKLMTGTDEQTAAMREFYKFYVENMEYCRDLLPASVGRDMLGKVGRVRGKFIDYAKKYTPAFFKAAAKSAGELFQVRVSTRQAMYDEDGNPVNQIPIFYTGGLRNEQKIDELEKQLEELEKEWKAKKISKADYTAKEKVLKKELDQALNALGAEEIEMDMVKNLGAFYDMTVSFDEMQRIEGVMQAVLRQLYDRYYIRMTATGKLEMDAKGNVVRRKGDDSRTAERFDAWMQMTFYSSQELDRNTFEVVAKKLMTLSSTTNIGFNGFGPIHNYVEARINLAIEAWGGSFFNRAAVRRASNAFRNEFLPGFVRNFNAMEGFYYKKKRMGSKYEALAKKFNMVRHTRLGEGKHKKSALDYVTYGFWGQDAGEFVAQTMAGMSYIDSYQIEGVSGENKGKKMSIYNAYDFDEASQTLTIKPGFEDFEKNEVLQHTITNTIWEINKQLNGNHSWEDRAMIQKEVLGMMAMQFHKWVYPAYKARFQRAYVDENRGKIEGRYITLYNMLLLFKDAEGNFIKRLNSAWHGLEPHQIKNMYRNMAELSYFSMCFAAYTLLKMVAENVDDDDKLKKRLVNFLAWEASRNQKGILFWWPGLGAKEQFEMIKNPFAAGTTVTQFADVIGAMGNLVMPPYNDDYFNKMYYDRGPFKGQLKLWKETKDLIPVLKELNRWATFDNVTSFHIK
jgi:hypothetical protein